MPLQPIETSTKTVAERAAQTDYANILRVAQAIVAKRKSGVKPTPPRPARQLPNGSVMPEYPGDQGCTAADYEASWGAQNIQILDALASALGTDSTGPNDSPTPA